MMLVRLRKRLELARRGHKLLKNKQEKLMQTFIALARDLGSRRRAVEDAFMEISMRYLKGIATTDRQTLEDALGMSTLEGDLNVSMRHEMNVQIPVFDFEIPDAEPAYRMATSSPELDSAFESLIERFEDLLKLASDENALFHMAEELEKTRRRVNALEYILIPDLEEQIGSIESKLSEAERSNQTRMMKIKDMVEARGSGTS